MMIGIRRVYKSVAMIGRAHESVAVILRCALNSEAEAKYQEGSGSSGEGQNQKMAASEPNIAGDLTKTRKKWYGNRRPGTTLESFACSIAKAIKEGPKFGYARDPYAVLMEDRALAQKVKEIEGAMPKLTPEERLRLGPCEVCGKEKDHMTRECPYLQSVPKGEEGSVREKYVVVCKMCNLEGGHPEKDWTGCAAIKYCALCRVVGDHRYTDCPNLEPEELERLRQRKRERCLLECNFRSNNHYVF